MSISEHTLSRVDTERLQKGIEGLASGAYTIEMTKQDGDEISAFISNGDGKRYSVSLALYAIRNPPLATAAPF